MGGKKHSVQCTLLLEPGEHGDKPFVSLKTGRSVTESGHSRAEIMDALTAGVESACLQGIDRQNPSHLQNQLFGELPLRAYKLCSECLISKMKCALGSS